MSTDDRATEMELWSPEVNSAIVRVPGRRFPGVLIQGDSLSILFDRAMTIAERLSTTSDSELRSTAEELAETLFAHVKNYEAVLEARGFDLPYVRDRARVPHFQTHDEVAG